MSDFSVTIDGIERVLAGLERMQRQSRAAQEAVIRPLGTAWKEALQAETPEGESAANSRKRLRDSYEVEESYSSAATTYHITNRAPHLGFVLKGRGPIVARRGRALRFEIGGQVIFRKRVGPAKANNFPPRARARIERQIDAAPEQIKEHLIRAYKG